MRVCIRKTSQYSTLEREYAQQFQLLRIESPQPSEFRFCLKFDDAGLGLDDLENTRTKTIRMNIFDLRSLSRKSILGRALGKSNKTVFDATAGLGGDALLMARMGFSVVAIERTPAIAALLSDGISRISAGSRGMSIRAVFGDAVHVLQFGDTKPEIIYLDPMYPKGRKPNVKVSRRLEVLRLLAGDEDNAEELLAVSIRSCRERVVVKRPTFASPLCPERLTNSLKGKLVRYDVYLANRS